MVLACNKMQDRAERTWSRHPEQACTNAARILILHSSSWLSAASASPYQHTIACLQRYREWQAGLDAPQRVLHVLVEALELLKRGRMAHFGCQPHICPSSCSAATLDACSSGRASADLLTCLVRKANHESPAAAGFSQLGKQGRQHNKLHLGSCSTCLPASLSQGMTELPLRQHSLAVSLGTELQVRCSTGAPAKGVLGVIEPRYSGLKAPEGL